MDRVLLTLAYLALAGLFGLALRSGYSELAEGRILERPSDLGPGMIALCLLAAFGLGLGCYDCLRAALELWSRPPGLLAAKPEKSRMSARLIHGTVSFVLAVFYGLVTLWLIWIPLRMFGDPLYLLYLPLAVASGRRSVVHLGSAPPPRASSSQPAPVKQAGPHDPDFA